MESPTVTRKLTLAALGKTVTADLSDLQGELHDHGWLTVAPVGGGSPFVICEAVAWDELVRRASATVINTVNLQTPKISHVDQVVRRDQQGEIVGSESIYVYDGAKPKD